MEQTDQTETAEGFKNRQVPKVVTEITADNISTTTIVDSVPIDSARVVQWHVYAISTTGEIASHTITATHDSGAACSQYPIDEIINTLFPGEAIKAINVELIDNMMVLKVQPKDKPISLQAAREILVQ